MARTRWADAHVVGQLPAQRERWLGALSQLARARRDGVLIPSSDRTSEFLMEERSRIPQNLRSFESAKSAHLELMNKNTLHAVAAQAGVRVPWTLHLSSPADLERVVDDASYPCLVKPVMSHQWRRLFGAWRVLPVENADALRRTVAAPLDAGLELLVTEHVPGPDRNLECAVTIRRDDGSYALAYGRRKVRQYPPGFGAGSVHESAEVPETMTLAKRLLDAVGFVGISGVETKRHARTGETVLIEVNVRLPQGFAVGDASGTDASWRLFATLAEIPVSPQPDQLEGVKVVVPSLEPRAAAAGLLRRRFTVRELLRSYHGVRSVSGLTWRDPAPVVALLRNEVMRAIRFARKRGWRSLLERKFFVLWLHVIGPLAAVPPALSP